MRFQEKAVFLVTLWTSVMFNVMINRLKIILRGYTWLWDKQGMWYAQCPAQDDAQGQLETIDYGSPFQKILPYVASGASPQIYVCPDDPDPHGAEILNAQGACLNGAGVPPGQLQSYLLNAYFLFGATEAQIPEPSEAIYIAERRSTGDVKTDFCDVHFHPWLGEIQAPTSSADTKDPIAIDSRRHSGGSNYVFADGHAKWQRFSLARQPFVDHELYGEFQAF